MAEPKIKRPASRKATTPTLKTNVTAIIKAEAQITSNAMEIEDGFVSAYDSNTIQPEINPEKYHAFLEQNNTLNQCVSAMEVNIDGTGQDLVRTDGEELDEKVDTKPIAELTQFFEEVYPGMSFTTLRRELRRQTEITGYGCVEVIRNPKDSIIFLRPLESKTIRLQKLGDPVTTVKTLIRGGVEAKVQLQTRERIFVQLNNKKKVFFKEYGSSRDLDKKTGEWADKGTRLPFNDRASEIIYTTIHRAASSPYGVPRWLNNLPSVIGSRSAEELNLEFFESGGIPPLMVFIAGGAMGETARRQLENLFSGRAKDKLKGVVADIQSTTGSIDKGGGVNVQIETFGSEKQQDSMFEKYDDKCERRVRASFRLPPLFVGKADDYSYASVFASYTVAEAQVFAPERLEFDELINNTIMKELTQGLYKIKSRPLTVADAETNLDALGIAVEAQVITKKGLIDEINKIGSLNIKALDGSAGEELAHGVDSAIINLGDSRKPVGEVPAAATEIDAGEVTKMDLGYLSDIANLQTRSLLTGLGKVEAKELENMFTGLNKFEKNMISVLTSHKLYASVEHDPTGMSELCACVAE